MEDRRVFTRIEARLPLRFRDLSQGKEGSAETINISANGLGLVTNGNLTIQTYIEMWVYIPDQHEPFHTRGEVIWSTDLAGTNYKRVGVRLEKEELMGLARALWINKSA